MKILVLPLLASISIILSSCGSDERISREVFEEVQRANEVKKLNEVDIFNEALKWGEQISREAQEQLDTALEQAMKEKGDTGAVEFCTTLAPAILKDLGGQYGVSIRRLPIDDASLAEQLLEEEKMLLEAYRYNEQNGIKHEPNLQKIEEGSILLFTKAITVPDGLCLNPDRRGDESVPEANGESSLAGMWSISIPLKEVVKRL